MVLAMIISGLAGLGGVVGVGDAVVAGSALAQLTATDNIPTSRTATSKTMADFDFPIIFLLIKYYT